jgi:hypothetical protein
MRPLSPPSVRKTSRHPAEPQCLAYPQAPSAAPASSSSPSSAWHTTAVSLAYAFKACAAQLAFCAAFLHVLQHRDRSYLVAQVSVLCGLLQQCMAWRRLRLHDPTRAKAGFESRGGAYVRERVASERSSKDDHVVLLSQNLWVHYLATPISQLLEHRGRAQSHASPAILNGLDFSGRIRAFVRYVEAAGADVVLVCQQRLSTEQFLASVFCNIRAGSGDFHHALRTISRLWIF